MIYFIQGDITQAIKIGFTTTSLKKRINEIRVACSENLILLGYEMGGYDREKELHQKFKSSLIRGEWFSPTPDLLKHIQKNTIKLPLEEDEDGCDSRGRKKVDMYISTEAYNKLMDYKERTGITMSESIRSSIRHFGEMSQRCSGIIITGMIARVSTPDGGHRDIELSKQTYEGFNEIQRRLIEKEGDS